MNRVVWLATGTLVVLLLTSLWQALEEAPDEAPYPEFDALRLSDGRLLLAWTDYARGRPEVRGAFVAPGETVSENTLLGAGRDPRIVSNGNLTLVTWRSGDGYDVARVASDGSAGKKLAPAGSLRPAHPPEEPSLALAPDGTLHLAYRAGGTVHWETYAVETDGAREPLTHREFAPVGVGPLPRLALWPNGSAALVVASRAPAAAVELVRSDGTAANLSAHFADLNGTLRELAVAPLPGGALALAAVNEFELEERSFNSLHGYRLAPNLTLESRHEWYRDSSLEQVALAARGNETLVVWADAVDNPGNRDYEIYLATFAEAEPTPLSPVDEERSYLPRIAATDPYEVIWIERAYTPRALMLHTEGDGDRLVTDHPLHLSETVDLIVIIVLVIGSLMGALLLTLLALHGEGREPVRLRDLSRPEAFLTLNTWRWLYSGLLLFTFLTFFFTIISETMRDLSGTAPLLVLGPVLPVFLATHLLTGGWLWARAHELRLEGAPLATAERMLAAGWLLHATAVGMLLWAQHFTVPFGTLFPPLVWLLFFAGVAATTLGVLGTAVALSRKPAIWFVALLFLGPAVRLGLSLVQYAATPVHLLAFGSSYLFTTAMENIFLSMGGGMLLYTVFSEGVKLGRLLGTGWIDQRVVARVVARELRASLLIHTVFVLIIAFYAGAALKVWGPTTLLWNPIFNEIFWMPLVLIGIGFILVLMARREFTLGDNLDPHTSAIQEAPLDWIQKAFFSRNLGLMGAFLMGMFSPVLGLAVVAWSVRDNLRMAPVIRRDFMAALTFHPEEGADEGFELEAVGPVRVRRPLLWPFFRRALNYSEYTLVGGALLMAIVVKMEFAVPLAAATRDWVAGGLALLLALGCAAALWRIPRFPRRLAEQEDVEAMLFEIENFLDELWLIMGALALALFVDPLAAAMVLVALTALVGFKLLYLEPRVARVLDELPLDRLTLEFDDLRTRAAKAELAWQTLVAPGELERIVAVMERRAAQIEALEARLAGHRELLAAELEAA